MRRGASSATAYRERMTYDAAAAAPAPGTQYAPHPSMQQQKPSRTFAVIALVLAGLELLVGLASTAAQALLITGDATSLLGPVSGVSLATSTLLALLAIVVAVLSVVRREPARALAGIALGVGIAGLVGLLGTGINYLLLMSA